MYIPNKKKERENLAISVTISIMLLPFHQRPQENQTLEGQHREQAR